ncbi:MAG: helix-turn-helix domain-containing protein, partial [Spirochaeta sp.]
DRKDVEEILSRLNNALSTECYRDPELTLAKMAKTIEVHPNRLSHAINQEYGMNFSRLVNSRRLDYFLRQVQRGDLERFTMLHLALESGFRSKSTFNRVFHERYCMSPTDYLHRETTAGRQHTPG